MKLLWGMTHMAIEPSTHLVDIACLWGNVTIVHLPVIPHEPQAAARARGVAHLAQVLGESDAQSKANAQIDVMNFAGLHTAVTVLMGTIGHLLAYTTDPVWTRNDAEEAVAELGLFMAAQQKSPWGLGCHTFVLPRGCSPERVEWTMNLKVGPKAVDVRLTQRCVDAVAKNPWASAEQHMLELAKSAGGQSVHTRQDPCPLGTVTTASCLLTMADGSARFLARATVYGEHPFGATCEISASMMTPHVPEPQTHHALMRVMMALGARL